MLHLSGTGSVSLSLLAVALLLWATDLSAQVPIEPPDSVAVAAPRDTVPVLPEGPPYSPRGAFFRSLVLPGWGQAHVGASGRGAVYFTLAAGSFWMTWFAHQQLEDAEREQQWLRDTGVIEADQETELVTARGRHFEDWVAFSVFLMFLSGADAYVSAYLSDFDERIGVLPGTSGNLRVEARVPLGPGR